MSMSQEEIEALMNGLDTDNSSEEEANTEEDVAQEPVQEEATPETVEESVDNNEVMSEDDIADLIAQTEVSQDEEKEDPVEDETPEEITSEDEPQEQEVVETEEEKPDDSVQTVGQDDIDDLLNGVDMPQEETPSEESVQEALEEATEVKNDDTNHEEIARSWTDKQIQEGVFPMPVEKNTKVVEQLSQVANDSEEKATRIFDVLSYIMDENLVVQKNSKELEEFVQTQISLLTTLSQKFPNIDIFKAQLEKAQSMQGKGTEIASKVDSENMQLFEAMELMQYHDINRQKIERVMSVIRKLNDYLNGIFEDDNTHAEVAVAKHIHGDSNNELVGDDDLDALIAEFGN